jgi:hypothetical protein
MKTRDSMQLSRKAAIAVFFIAAKVSLPRRLISAVKTIIAKAVPRSGVAAGKPEMAAP